MSMNMQNIVRAIAMSVTVCAIMALLLHVLDWQLNWGGGRESSCRKLLSLQSGGATKAGTRGCVCEVAAKTMTLLGNIGGMESSIR